MASSRSSEASSATPVIVGRDQVRPSRHSVRPSRSLRPSAHIHEPCCPTRRTRAPKSAPCCVHHVLPENVVVHITHSNTLDALRRVQGLLDAQAMALGPVVPRSLRARLDGAVVQLSLFQVEQSAAAGIAKGETVSQAAPRKLSDAVHAPRRLDRQPSCPRRSRSWRRRCWRIGRPHRPRNPRPEAQP